MVDLAALQHDVLTTAQAISIFGEPMLRRRLRRREWQRVYSGVVVLHNGPLTPGQQRWAHLLVCPRGSVLGGPTALELEGLKGFETPTTYVVIPEGGRAPKVAGLVTHWSTYLDERDVNPSRFPPRTRNARSTVDFASWSDNERYARAIVLAAAQQRLVRTADLRDALPRRGHCRHRRLIVESYLDAAGGIQSLPERDFDQIRARFGLPSPSRQVKVQRADKRYYLDVAWQAYGVGCEIHGIPHLQVRKWDADNGRGNELVISGRRTVFFSSYAIRHEAEIVGDQVTRLLVSAGWRP